MKLSLAEARALTITAQGLAGPRETGAGKRELRALVDRLGVVQIDSVNVLVRSHYLPAFSRLGPYDRAMLDALAHRAPRALFEYWGHEASLLPVALYPLFRWRMERAGHHAWGRMRRIAKEQPDLVERVLDLVREQGPIAASDIELGAAKSRKGWWEWSDAKVAVEWLFWSGQVTSAQRRGFERQYDLPERVLPAKVIVAPVPAEHDAQRLLVERAARAMAIGTEADLRDYYRLPVAGARRAIAELVEAGELTKVAVEGWTKPAYLHHRAKPARLDPKRPALLSPFDSLIWARERTERLFGMRFRLEIYTPQHKRVHGYYVLPLLVGDRLVARVDLKADRKAGVLLVHAAHAEPGARNIAAPLAEELSRMAHWLELDRVAVGRRGDLARGLNRVIGA
jgi:uncharacterized protein YcaQ